MLGPFDLVYDRGCYHGVRRQNAAGYVDSLRRLTRAGSQILILAGNANEERNYGPPRVKEEEIRADFSGCVYPAARVFDLQYNLGFFGVYCRNAECRILAVEREDPGHYDLFFYIQSGLFVHYCTICLA